MRRVNNFFLLILIFSLSNDHAAAVEASDIHEDFMVACYHYDPNHPYLDPDQSPLFPRVYTSGISGVRAGSFVLTSAPYEECEARCNEVIPLGHQLLKMRASRMVDTNEDYTISFNEGPQQGDYKFKRVVLFGDSLSEEGNVVQKLIKFRHGLFGPALKGYLSMTGCSMPEHFFDYGLKPYWNGMFSNGPLWPRYLSEFLDHVAIENLAYGGCSTGPRRCNRIHFQMLMKEHLRKNEDISQNLYIIWLGANNYFYSNPTKTAHERFIEVSLAIDELSSSVSALCDAGAKQVLLFTVPNPKESPSWQLDDFSVEHPSYYEPTKVEWQNSVDLHNVLLKQGLASMNKSPECQVHLFDADQAFSELATEFNVNTTKAWKNDPNPQEGYFDPVHPTTLPHCLLAVRLATHLHTLGLAPKKLSIDQALRLCEQKRDQLTGLSSGDKSHTNCMLKERARLQ